MRSSEFSPETTARGRRDLSLLLTFLALAGFALADAGIVAWYARVLNAAEIFAAGFTFALVSLGAIMTVRKLDR
jgi:hypothetical protein